MPIVHDRQNRLVEFKCSECRTPLGWTTEGEAMTMHRRALHLCNACVEKPPALTGKQVEVLEVAADLRKTLGRTPVYDEIAEQMGVARSRVSALVINMKERGYEDAWNEAVYGE